MMMAKTGWSPLVIGTLVVATLSGAARAQVAISETASRHFNEGVRHLTTREPDRFEKAYSAFQAAHADSPSWKILGNLGIVAEALERDDEAIEAYRGYVQGGAQELGAAERDQFLADLARLELGSAVVRLQTQPDGAWLIDERVPPDGSPVVNRYGPSSGPLELRIRAGRHRIHAELSGHVSETWDFEARPGASGSHGFELRRASVPSETPPRARLEPFDDRLGEPRDHPAARIAGYSALGLGGLGTAIGTWFLIRAYERLSEGDAALEDCKDGVPARCLVSDQKTHEETRERIRSGVSFGVAGSLLATGVVLLLYAGPPSPAANAQQALTPWVGPGQLGIAGRF